MYLWKNGSVIRLTNDNVLDFGPSLYNGTVAWSNVTKITDVANYGDVLYWDSLTTQTIAKDVTVKKGGNGTYVSLYDGQIAWQALNGDDGELFYYDGMNVSQVTDNDANDIFPSLYNGTIAWSGYDGAVDHTISMSCG